MSFSKIQAYLLMVLRSNRVKAMVVAFIMAAFKKYLPDLMPDDSTMNWLYGVLLAFIAGDTVRPIDPAKPKMIG